MIFCQPQVPGQPPNKEKTWDPRDSALLLDMTIPWKVTVQTHTMEMTQQQQPKAGSMRFNTALFLWGLPSSLTPLFPLMQSASPCSSFLCCIINQQVTLRSSYAVKTERSSAQTSSFSWITAVGSHLHRWVRFAEGSFRMLANHAHVVFSSYKSSVWFWHQDHADLIEWSEK